MRAWMLVFIFLFFACGKKGNQEILSFSPAKLTSFESLINPPLKKVDLQADIVLINNDYPIELAIYQDQRFYYNLPNLGDGYGIWEYLPEKGQIHLFAVRKLFDMHIDVKAIKGEKNFGIEFEDRFGLKTLRLEHANALHTP